MVLKNILSIRFAIALTAGVLIAPLCAQEIVRIPAEDAQMQIKRQVPIATEVAGTLVIVNPLEEGVSVKKDELLIKLNDSVILAEVERARKQSLMKTEIEFAEVALETALENQKTKQAANERRPGAFTPSEMRQVALEVRKGEAQLSKSNDDMILHGEDLKIKEAQLNQYSVLAPFDGFVTKVQKYPGQNVRPGDPVLTLTDISELRASLKVHFRHRDQLFVGDEVEIRIDTQERGAGQPATKPAPGSDSDLGSIFDDAKKSGPKASNFEANAEPSPQDDGVVFIGKIDLIDPKVEPDSTQSLMIKLGVTVPNRKDKHGRYMLQEGMPVKAVILARKRTE